MQEEVLFLNRELSWLKFNSRVLEQCKKNIPIMDKLKFLAIYCTNLDEFYMIRVAGLKQLFIAGIAQNGNDKMTPLDQLREIRRYINKEQEEFEKLYYEIKEELYKENIFIKNYDELNENEKEKADEYFLNQIMPIIVPIAVDGTRPFPHINNLGFVIAVKLQDLNNIDENKFGMIKISKVLPRFVIINENIFIPIEEIICKHVEKIFPGYTLVSSASFRVTRNADIVIEEEEADDFMLILEQGLKRRKKGAFVRLQIQKNADFEIMEFLNSHLNIFYKDIYEYSVPLSLDGLMQIAEVKDFSYLSSKPYTPKILPPFEKHSSIFSAIDKEDVLLYHPFESFEPVVEFIKEAAKDEKVISIRITLYRVGKNSSLIKALIDAANEGKQVTAMVELKARFDEENNLHWAKALENAGAHVIYGIAGFKVHAKVAQVIKKVGDKLKFYNHISTGNYNANSAKIYTDVSLFTSNENFAKDTTTFFHILSGYNKNKRLDTLCMSPIQIKQKLLEMIKNEIRMGSNGYIVAKMNALVDGDMINALYNASQAGVKIDLIVRGICCLKPGIKGISENIRVISIVGKYLEHARIFYFKHSNPAFYIASADWMHRNLERRLELMSPIFNENLQAKLRDILMLQLKDNYNSFLLQEDGEYIKIKNDNEIINNHEILEKHFDKIQKNIKRHENLKIKSKLNDLL